MPRSWIGSRHIHQGATGEQLKNIRNFITGDSLRNIDAKKSLKYKALMTREWEEIQSQNICLCLDTSRYMSGHMDSIQKLDFYSNGLLKTVEIATKNNDQCSFIQFAQSSQLTIKKSKKYNKFHQLIHSNKIELHPNEESDFMHLYSTIKHNFRSRTLIIIFSDFSYPAQQTKFIQLANKINKKHLLLGFTLTHNELKISNFLESVNTKDIQYKDMGDYLYHLKNDENKNNFTLACQNKNSSAIFLHDDEWANGISRIFSKVRQHI